jgi:hypothetical protein
MLLFIRAQKPGRDLPSLIDGAIVASAFGLLSWLYVIQPTVAATETPLIERAIGMAYPVLDVLMLTMATLRSALGGVRTPSGSPLRRAASDCRSSWPTTRATNG